MPLCERETFHFFHRVSCHISDLILNYEIKLLMMILNFMLISSARCNALLTEFKVKKGHAIRHYVCILMYTLA